MCNEMRADFDEAADYVRCSDCEHGTRKDEAHRDAAGQWFCGACRRACAWCGEIIIPEEVVRKPGSSSEFCSAVCAERGV